NAEFFDKFNIGIFKIVDRVGSLGEFCQFLANFYKKIAERKEKIKKQLRYPILLTAFFLIAFSLIVKFLIPNIIDLQKHMGVKVSFILRCLFYISSHFLSVLGLSSLIGFSVFYFLVKSNKIHIIKKYRDYRDFSFFFYVSYILLSNNLNLLDAFEIAKESIYNQENLNKIEKICKNVESGNLLSDSFDTFKIDPLATRLVLLYEKSSNLKEGFLIISELFENEMFKILERVAEYAQPISICLLGLLILITLYAMLIPLYNSFFV
ncbi:MAG: type II secretion system F family protein, partial [Ignavibacteriae bacterium]|nr:type II secretion system F family protein [Ignavibacteriota bacterium]